MTRLFLYIRVTLKEMEEKRKIQPCGFILTPVLSLPLSHLSFSTGGVYGKESQGRDCLLLQYDEENERGWIFRRIRIFHQRLHAR